jgi:hypothetical protein
MDTLATTRQRHCLTAVTIETERSSREEGVGVPTRAESAGTEEDFTPKAAGDVKIVGILGA